MGQGAVWRTLGGIRLICRSLQLEFFGDMLLLEGKFIYKIYFRKKKDGSVGKVKLIHDHTKGKIEG